jgi:hypothetical protein
MNAYTQFGAFSRFAPRVDPIENEDGTASEQVRVAQDPYNLFYYWSNARGVLIAPPNRMKSDFGSIPKTIQRVPRLDRMTFLPSYISHDDLYWFKYCIKPAFVAGVDEHGMIQLTPAQMSCLIAGVMEQDDNLRISIYMNEYSIVPVKRLWSDGTLNEMMCVQTRGDATWERKVVQTGLFIGGGIPWWLHERRKANKSDNYGDPNNYEAVTV